ncbi:MAG: hypothetical protein QXU98_08905 [Candidatus Parvarchaeota archaeon]
MDIPNSDIPKDDAIALKATSSAKLVTKAVNSVNTAETVSATIRTLRLPFASIQYPIPIGTDIVTKLIAMPASPT